MYVLNRLSDSVSRTLSLQSLRLTSLSALLFGSVIINGTAFANEQDEKKERVPTEELVEGIKSSDGRWFEVEVIIFERTDNKDVRETFEQPVPNLSKKRQWYFFDHIFNPELSQYLKYLPNCNQHLDPIEKIKLAFKNHVDVFAEPEPSQDKTVETAATSELFIEGDEVADFDDLNPVMAPYKTNVDEQDLIDPTLLEQVEPAENKVANIEELDATAPLVSADVITPVAEFIEYQFEPTFSDIITHDTPNEFWLEFQNYQKVISSEWQFENNLCLTANEALPAFWVWYLDISESDLTLNQDVSYEHMFSRPTGPDFDDFHDVYLIAPQNLQLIEQYEKLAKSKSTRPLLHLGWRQPGLSKRRAMPVYLKAGGNYSGSFTYEGNPIPEETLQAPLNTETRDLPEALVESGEQAFNKNEIDKVEQFMDKLQNGAVVDFRNNKLVMPNTDAMPDESWQLDGYITVHLNHYLFLDAEFNYRQQETKLLDPSEYLDQLDLLINTKQQPKTEMQGELDDAVVISKISQVSGFDDVNTVPTDDKVEYKYLKNYPFKQNRRTYSGDLHYLDHPKIGVLFQIRKYRH